MRSTMDTVPNRASRVERRDVVVVGAGQAGLAAGYHLARRDADVVLLDGADRVGDSWRRRWDSLRLFTPAAYSGLPGMPFPAAPAHLPDKDEAADYLERYAERFELPVRTGVRVRSLRRDGEWFALDAGDRTYEARRVIVATGPFQRPRVPDLAARVDPAVAQLHSSQYTNPWALPEGPVLVVGAGNSGAQIAMELARFRKVWLAGRETGRLPRRVLGRDIYDWIWPTLARASVDTRLGRRFRQRALRGDPLVGITPRQIAEAGVERVGRVDGVADGKPVAGGRVLAPSVIVWCTGFGPDYSWLGLPVLGADGWPVHRRGVVPGAPGLFVLGLRFQHTQTSALMGGVGADAAFIAERVAEGIDGCEELRVA